MRNAMWVGGGITGMGEIPMLGVKEKGIAKVIRDIFRNGEQGFFYEPSDMESVYQDAAGTIPVTGLYQAVGTIHDKSGRNNHVYQTSSAARPIFQQKPILGSELVVNGDFSTGISNWNVVGGSTTKAVTWVDSSLKVASETAGTCVSSGLMSTPLVVGKRYQVSGNCIAYDSVGGLNTVYIGDGGQLIGTLIAVGRFSFTFTATLASTKVNIGRTSGGSSSLAYSQWDNISVKEVLSYRTDQNYIEYDGVDDKLITNLPAPLNNATVLRAIPNEGTQVKYNQTLPMLYEDSTTHAGLIAIDRALTHQEQLRLMEELDKKAGAAGFYTTTFKMFDSNQEGFVYDPNDLSSLYQDAAGTIPVTAAGQPVGLILDKSKGLESGINVATGFTPGFIPAGSVAEGLEGSTPGTLSSNWFPVTPSAFYKIHAPVSNRCRVQVKNASGVIKYLNAYSTETSADTRLVSALADSVLMRIYFANEVIGSQVTTFEVRKLSGNHAYQTTSASRPILRKNAVTGANYLEFDGADDFLQTNNIDFTATDKVSLFAGVRKLSDKGNQTIVELSSNTDALGRAFKLSTEPNGSTYFAARGTTSSYIGRIDKSPITLTFAAKASFSPSRLWINVNGNTLPPKTVGMGGVNYGNYPLYIGIRGGTSTPFNGHIYGLIGIGKLATDTETTIIEKELAKRTGVDLNV